MTGFNIINIKSAVYHWGLYANGWKYANRFKFSEIVHVHFLAINRSNLVDWITKSEDECM